MGLSGGPWAGGAQDHSPTRLAERKLQIGSMLAHVSCFRERAFCLSPGTCALLSPGRLLGEGLRLHLPLLPLRLT